MVRKYRLFILMVLFLGACSSFSQDNGSLEKANREYAKGNYFQARRLYEQYLEFETQGKKRWEAWSKLLGIALNIQHDQRKGTLLLEAMCLEYMGRPERYRSLLPQLAGLYTDLREWEKAAEAWQKALALEGPDSEKAGEIYWNLGKVYQFQGQYSMAQEAMAGCMERALDPGLRAKCMYEMAQTFSLLKNQVQARIWLEKIQELEDADQELKATA
ncbi:MAG: tetratricopeptide repeat protein, partial [Thermodesulfobacteriota bacterium]|nr:tetratricopeptide repeat protein [Thermodesulfobacteriota bacterium]